MNAQLFHETSPTETVNEKGFPPPKTNESYNRNKVVSILAGEVVPVKAANIV